LGACHNEHTRNWNESHVLFKRAISRDGPLSSNPVGSESFALQAFAEVTSRENSVPAYLLFYAPNPHAPYAQAVRRLTATFAMCSFPYSNTLSW